ncbi:hypothetical protein PoB_005729100 [Plakobranchus ocellatus]|uniref:Uncharacterized protein n=1 Tax=Plakobranchus ocellatus TaxID=259542 RepID=A0AAV4CDG0_9GAST|nr:hypothetical protein PoB_005729100 [Plakobranchus ocellatus]
MFKTSVSLTAARGCEHWLGLPTNLQRVWEPGLASKRINSRFKRVSTDCAVKGESESDYIKGVTRDRDDGARNQNRGDSPDDRPRLVPGRLLHAVKFLVPQTGGDSLDS